MSRRQQASRVTIGTLIEAARKVKRPDLRKLRQMRRNGRELSSEELALVCEVFEVDPKSVVWVNPVLAELMDPSMAPSMVRLTIEDPELANPMYSGLVSNVEPILAFSDENEEKRFCETSPVFSALMNPAMEYSYLIATIAGQTKADRSTCWPYLVRNQSLFLSTMMDPDLPWHFVDVATSSLKSGMRDPFYFEQYDGKHTREKAVRWTKEDRKFRTKAALYASALEFVSFTEGWEGELEELGEEDSSSWRHLEKRKIGDIQPRGPTSSVVDWAAHARVINLILPYFEDMNRLGIFR